MKPDVVPKQHGAHRSLTGPLRMFMGLALVAGVVAVAGSKSGATSAFDVTAQSATVPTGTPATSAAIRVSWNWPHQIPPDAIVQYQVYRVDPTMGAPILVGIALRGRPRVVRHRRGRYGHQLLRGHRR